MPVNYAHLPLSSFDVFSFVYSPNSFEPDFVRINKVIAGGTPEELEIRAAKLWGTRRWRSPEALLEERDDGLVGILKEKGRKGSDAMQDALQIFIEKKGISELTIAADGDGYRGVVRGREGTTMQVDYFRSTEGYVMQIYEKNLQEAAERRVSQLEKQQPRAKTEEACHLMQEETAWRWRSRGMRDAGWRDGSTTEDIGVLVYSVDTGEGRNNKKVMVDVRHQRKKPMAFSPPTTYSYNSNYDQGGERVAQHIKNKIGTSFQQFFPHAEEREALERGQQIQFTVYFSGYESKGVPYNASIASAYIHGVKQGISAIFENIAAVYKSKRETQEIRQIDEKVLGEAAK